MRRTVAIPVLASFLLTAVLLALVPNGPVHLADATHEGDILCPSRPDPVHDGTITPDEYAENFFDPHTKTLVYFNCKQDANRTMHLALFTPRYEWTEFRFQATNEWNGDFNVVRVSMAGPTAEGLDGFIDGNAPDFVEDLAVGGTHDVAGLVGAASSDHYIYEFELPLLSSDSYDSQLTVNGSFAFQLVLGSGETSAESELRFLQIGQPPASGLWTSVELSLPEGNIPESDAEMLVSLRDNRSRPMPFRPVSVFVETTFGFLDIETVLTNEQGVASVLYAPREAGSYLVGAAFEGESGFLASVSWLKLELSSHPAELTIIPSGDLMVRAVVVLVVGGVWGAYAYSILVVRQALRSKEGRSVGTQGDQQ